MMAARYQATIDYDAGNFFSAMFEYRNNFVQTLPLATKVQLTVHPQDGMYIFRVFAFGKVVHEEQCTDKADVQVRVSAWFNRQVQEQDSFR
jgi:hypothetical protein